MENNNTLNNSLEVISRQPLNNAETISIISNFLAKNSNIDSNNIVQNNVITQKNNLNDNIEIDNHNAGCGSRICKSIEDFSTCLGKAALCCFQVLFE